MKKTNILIMAVIIISFIIGIYLYPSMPEEMASHWNAKGEVDDYMSKFWGLFLMPIVTLGLFLLFLIIPLIDPLKKNIEKFRGYFDAFIALIILFLFYIYVLSILWNLNYRFDMSQAIIPAIAIIFYFAGVLMEKAKMNWFIGIRTPWTLSSKEVWEKTHKLGAKLYKILAFVFLLILLSPEYFTQILMIIIVIALYPLVYSYFEYRKLKR
ncbi:SdpI family protein [Candidatus Woesearchaeota archaeon]|nr:SdpI family protein [Candidatus Woesearchaeota archaeon]